MYLLTASAYDAQPYPTWNNSLSHTAQRLYDALRSAGEVVRDHRGYHPGVTVVTFFCPVDAVAMAIGVSRQTVYNRMPELVAAGLVHQRAHYCTHQGQTKSDGSLWAVRLNPGESVAPVRVEFDWMKGHYRNLGADIASGRTAWSALQSYSRKDKSEIDLNPILAFSIFSLEEPINSDCKAYGRFDLEALLDVTYADDDARNEAVDLAARALAAELGASSSSLNMWRWLVWSLLRLEKAGQGSYWYQVYLMAQRAGVDRREGSCTNPGGLFVSRLKASRIWEELRAAPLMRIGTRPLKSDMKFKS